MKLTPPAFTNAGGVLFCSEPNASRARAPLLSLSGGGQAKGRVRARLCGSLKEGVQTEYERIEPESGRQWAADMLAAHE